MVYFSKVIDKMKHHLEILSSPLASHMGGLLLHTFLTLVEPFSPFLFFPYSSAQSDAICQCQQNHVQY